MEENNKLLNINELLSGFRYQLLFDKQIQLIGSIYEKTLKAYSMSYNKQVKHSLELCRNTANMTILIRNIGHFMKLTSTDRAIYVSVIYTSCMDAKIYNCHNDAHITIKYPKRTEVTFCFYEDGSVMQTMISNPNRYIPASLKSIWIASGHCYLFKIFMKYYFKSMIMKNQGNVFKDLLRDMENGLNMNSPIPLNYLKGIPTYQSLFSNYYHYNYKIPKSINKMSLGEAHFKTKFCKNVSENELQKIWNLTMDMSSLLDEKDLICSFYSDVLNKPYIDKKYNIEWELEDKIDVLENYYKMAIKVNGFVSLSFRSFRKILDAYHNLIIPYAKKVGSSKMTIPKESPFRKLKLPEHYKLIKTGSALFQESLAMHNCVYHYREKVNQGTCAILHIDYQSQPYTAEIRMKRTKFVCVQLLGLFNTLAPIELSEELETVLKETKIKKGIAK